MDQKVIFMLDMFLDTRLPTLGLLDPTLPSAILSDQSKLASYSERPNDNFENFGIAKGRFKSLFNERTADTLVISKPTRFLYDLPRISKQILAQRITNPLTAGDIYYYVNMWPYTDLTADEVDKILGAIYTQVPNIIYLEAICMSPEQMNSRYIRDAEITSLFIYDLVEWLNACFHTGIPVEHIVENPAVTIFAPISIDNFDSLKEMAEFTNPAGVKNDPINGIQVACSPFFSLEVVNSMMTSIITPAELAILKEEEFKNNVETNQSP